MKTFYQQSIEEVFNQLNSSFRGLHPDAVTEIQQKEGANELKEVKQRTRLSILSAQFTDWMILLLIVAAVISFLVGEHMDAYVILAIVLVNAWMGYSQEYHAEQSVRLLQKMSAQHAMVVRNNNPVKIDSRELVPGDLLLLEAGDIIPADARLIETNSFKTDEASLTGESHSIEKKTDILNGQHPNPGDQFNMVFKGTNVSNGSAKAIVTSIGMKTEIGVIARLLEVADRKTPLQQRLIAFSKQLAVIIIIICVVLFGLGVWRGEPPLEMFLTALSLAVAALPEALPAVITIALAQGASRMARQKALVRKLPAVETLGSVTYICSDKTGTLTRNLMTVEKTMATEGNETLLQSSMILNNEVRFSSDGGFTGDSTETALVAYAIGKGLSKEQAHKDFPLLKKLPFDSRRMMMSTLHQFGNQWILFVKGAPVKILEALRPALNPQKKAWQDLNREWAAQGLRVLFFAYRIFDKQPHPVNASLESNLDFLGMTAMIDPPRKEVTEAIGECKTAGIRIVMITGDQPITAGAIAERLGIIEHGVSQVKSGKDLSQLTEKEFDREIRNVAVYARVSPEQKLNFVKGLQRNGEFVAMTGDGVNDAPSLKQADIGVAMGITGTDVSKEASDMILLDDNFSTIVRAVKEGRRIYDNIRKFIVYILSCNMGEILVLTISPALGFAIPLLPIQILWINLVTDGLPGLALVGEPAEKDIMERPPRPTRENLFAGNLIRKIVYTGIIIAAVSVFIQWWSIQQGYDVRTQQTMVFLVLCFVQLGNALSVRITHRSVFSSELFANRPMWAAIVLTTLLQLAIVYLPFLRTVFKTAYLDWHAMLAIGMAMIVSLFCIEFLKRLLRPAKINIK
jgi:Ca2+-transporting ATPase